MHDVAGDGTRGTARRGVGRTTTTRDASAVCGSEHTTGRCAGASRSHLVAPAVDAQKEQHVDEPEADDGSTDGGVLGRELASAV